MAALSGLVTSYIHYKTWPNEKQMKQNSVAEIEILQVDFFISQTVQLGNDTSQRNGSTAIFRKKEDFTPRGDYNI